MRAKKAQTPPTPKAKVVEKIVEKKVTVNKLSQAQLDSLGLRIAGLPISNKDKDFVVSVLIDELGITDGYRFSQNAHEVNIPTPKT